MGYGAGGIPHAAMEEANRILVDTSQTVPCHYLELIWLLDVTSIILSRMNFYLVKFQREVHLILRLDREMEDRKRNQNWVQVIMNIHLSQINCKKEPKRNMENLEP